MTTITIVPEAANKDDFRAIAGLRQSVGKTPGEALDAIAAQLSSEEAGTLVVVQNRHPDRFFTAQQQRRLEELMGLWRSARDNGDSLDPKEQAEMDALVAAEIDAAKRRAAALADELKS